MHFIVFSYKYITTTKSKIKAYKSPPASRILQAASRSSFCLCAMAKEKNSFWRSFFHPCAMRGQDDVSALKARRMQIRGTQPRDWKVLSEASVCFLETWVAQVWKEKKGQVSTAAQPPVGTNLWSLIHRSNSGSWGRWWAVVKRGRMRSPEVCKYQGNMTLDKQTLCCPNLLSASAILLSPRQMPPTRSTKSILREQPWGLQPQSLAWSCVHWSKWGPGRDCSSVCNHHPLETAVEATVTGFSCLVPRVHTRQCRQWNRGAECKGDSTQAYITALTLTSVCLGQVT